MNLETVSKVKCIECLNLSIQASFKYNKDTGLGVCKKRKNPVALNWNRPCKDFELATTETIIKRLKWQKDEG